MKFYLYPRPLPVLRRAHRFVVPIGQDPSDAGLSSLQISPHPATAPLHPAFTQTHPTQLRLFLIPLHQRRPIQNT